MIASTIIEDIGHSIWCLFLILLWLYLGLLFEISGTLLEEVYYIIHNSHL